MRGRSMSAASSVIESSSAGGRSNAGIPRDGTPLRITPRSSSTERARKPAAVCQIRTALGSMPVSMTDRTLLLKKLARILRDGSQDKGQENKEPHGSL